MENLELYERVRRVPQEAKKAIKGGRLNGMTDINPMWRIKALTEQFGPCGIGWKYVITDKRLENGANGEIAAFLDIDLYIKADGQWSEAIPGTGGSSFVAKERNGLYTSDECYKMALTDAISVACKTLGMGADVYWEKDRTKYTAPEPEKPMCAECGQEIAGVVARIGGANQSYTAEEIVEMSRQSYGKQLCWQCCKAARKVMVEAGSEDAG